MTMLPLLGYLAAAIALFVGGIAFHGWMTRQKSPTLTLDAIKAATAILAAARAESAGAVLAATQRDEAVALALKHAAETLTTTTVQ
jgi:drug/metabolite transporter superfamily protein YnfA